MPGEDLKIIIGLKLFCFVLCIGWVVAITFLIATGKFNSSAELRK